MLLFACGLTFELSGRHRRGAWAARPMIDNTVSRPKCLAGGGPLERRVRPRLAGKRYGGADGAGLILSGARTARKKGTVLPRAQESPTDRVDPDGGSGGSDGTGLSLSCACTATKEGTVLPGAQEPLTDSLGRRERRDWFEKPSLWLVLASTRFVPGDAVAALLRGVQASDFEARLVRSARMVRGHGALRGLTFELSGRHRRGPARRMMNHNGSRGHAGGGPLERRVRPRVRRLGAHALTV